MRKGILMLVALTVLVAPVGAGIAHAQTCTPKCQSGYTCTTGNVCVQKCSDGSVAGPSGCTVDEIVVTAAKKSTGPAFADVVNNIQSFVDSYIVPLLYILAFLFFLVGLVQYFFLGGEENRQKGRSFVLWGLVGMVVIFGVWGIVRLLLSIIPGT